MGPKGRLGTRACLAVMIATLTGASPALAHEGNPSFRSEVNRVRPAVPGLSIEVLNYDDRLLLTNRTGKTVLVRGYDDEPYLRIRGDGTVQVNELSPTFYLNEDRFAQVEVPPQADEKAPPRWEVVGKGGRYEWHDHRIHWMSKGIPPQVKDEDKAAKLFDWGVPIEAGARPVRVTGTLSWEPTDSGVPPAALIALGGLATASLFLFALSRRVRTRKLAQRGSGAW
jgi:hypothetical protein